MQPDTILCRRCGAANTGGDQFCGSCGAFLEWEGDAAPAPDDRRRCVPLDPPPLAPAAGPAEPAAPDRAPRPNRRSPPPPPTPGFAVCPTCGSGNPPGRTFCHSCGKLLVANPGRCGGRRRGRRQGRRGAVARACRAGSRSSSGRDSSSGSRSCSSPSSSGHPRRRQRRRERDAHTDAVHPAVGAARPPQPHRPADSRRACPARASS